MEESKKTLAICPYCGLVPADTRDHVIPKCLFPGPLPQFMVTVPACRPCKESKAKDDDYLRDMFSIDIESDSNPHALHIRNGKMMRSAKRRSSIIARDVINKTRFKEMRSAGGIILGQFPAVPLDGERIERIFTRITRGLYYFRHKERIPDSFDFTIEKYFPQHKVAAVQSMLDADCNGPFMLQERVFTCMYLMSAEDRFVTFWLQAYYNALISVTTAPKGFIWRPLDGEDEE